MKKALLILVGVMVGFGGCFLYVYKKDASKSLNLHHVVKESAELKKWASFHSKDGYYTAAFPKSPDSNERKLPIPGSNNSLDYHEHFCVLDGGVRYSVSYTTLPDSWLKYGNSLVLSEALKVIMKELGKSHLVGKEAIQFKSFPALDYEHYNEAKKKKQREYAGTLILVENVLYKVEISYPLKRHHQMQNHVANFIESFSPEKIEDPKSFQTLSQEVED